MRNIIKKGYINNKIDIKVRNQDKRSWRLDISIIKREINFMLFINN